MASTPASAAAASTAAGGGSGSSAGTGDDASADGAAAPGAPAPGAPAPLTLALLGDVMLGRLVNGLLNKTKAPAVSVFGPSLLPLLRRADAGIANLECALTASTEPWSRTPKAFHFRAAPAHVSALTGAGVRAGAITPSQL